MRLRTNHSVRRTGLLSSVSGFVVLAGMAMLTPEQAQAACSSTLPLSCVTDGDNNIIDNTAVDPVSVTGDSTTELTTVGGNNTISNAVSSSLFVNGDRAGDVSNTSTFVLQSSTGSNLISNSGTFGVGYSEGNPDTTDNNGFALTSQSGNNTIENNAGATFSVVGTSQFVLTSETGNNLITNGVNASFSAIGANVFQFQTQDGSNTLYNQSEAAFEAIGNNAFSFSSANGDNLIQNDLRGVITATGYNTFDFSNPNGTSTVQNGGIIETFGRTSFNGLDNFNNAGGVLSLVNNVSYLPVNGVSTRFGSGVGDVTYISGNFNGSLGSVIAVDATLHGPNDSSSDVVVIGGKVTGTTDVYINNLSTKPGGYDPNGVLVVDVQSGNAAPGSFRLLNGPIDTGLFSYDIYQAPVAGGASDSNFVLASYADSSSFALPQFTTLSRDIWNSTSDGWIDRAGDLRESFAATEAVDPSKRSGIWGRFIGGSATSTRDQSVTTVGGRTVQADAGYDQTLFAFQAGVDHEFDGTVANGVLMAGVLGGYVASAVDLSNNETINFTGPQVGAYASWIKGPLYIDALVKGDFLSADYNIGGSNASTDSTTIGGRVETGYRFFTANGMFIEPVASLAYTNTSIDNIVIGGAAVNFDDGDGLEGKVLTRFGGSFLQYGAKVDPYVSLGIAGDLLGNNSVTIDSGPGLVVEDNAPDVFGEVGAGFNVVVLKNGVTGFAKADLRFGEDYVGGTGKFGMRWTW